MVLLCQAYYLQKKRQRSKGLPFTASLITREEDAPPSAHQRQQRYAASVVRPRHLSVEHYYTGCEEVMALLDECHARGFLYKAIGGCNRAKHDVNMCLRAERLERTKVNRERAKVERQKVLEKWQEIDANS